jgi:tetratricopeptide (TPR) repeat protein
MLLKTWQLTITPRWTSRLVKYSWNSRVMIRSLTIIMLALLLGGCSHYYATRSDVSSRVDEWLKQDKYGNIFYTLDNVKRDHPQYQKLQKMLPEIRQSARQYESRISKEALELARAHQWQEALERYEQGIDKYPQSTLLRNEKQRFLNDRDEYLQYLDRKFSYDQGEWLLKALPRQQEIVRTNPRDSEQKERLEELQELARQTEKQIGRFGLEAMKAEKFLIADRYLSLANNLHPRSEYRIALAQIQQKSLPTPKSKPAQKDYQTKKKKLNTAQLNRFHQYFEEAYEREEWSEAKNYLEQIQRLSPMSKRTQEADNKLALKINDYIQQQIKLGEHQYSQGEFERALKTWESALPLDPDNEDLNKHIIRAQKVLKNLEELEGRSPSVRFPVESEPSVTPAP